MTEITEKTVIDFFFVDEFVLFDIIKLDSRIVNINYWGTLK